MAKPIPIKPTEVEIKAGDVKGEPIIIDLNKIYHINPEDMKTDITTTTYSNVAYIQITGRDVFIDFLQMPGIKKNNDVIVNGTRVYMSFYSAQRLSNALNKTLAAVYAAGGMEQYTGKDDKNIENEA